MVVLQIITAMAAGAFIAIVAMERLIKLQKKTQLKKIFEISDKYIENICRDYTKDHDEELSMADIEYFDENLERIYNEALKYNPEAGERIKRNALKIREEEMKKMLEDEKNRPTPMRR